MKKSLLAALVLASTINAVPASASVIQLGFILDESGSIGSSNYTIIKNGLGNALSTLIPTDSTYEISVVSFSSSAQTLVNHVLIDSAATLSSVVSAITSDSFAGGGTDMAAAFDAMSLALQGSRLDIVSTYVNLATDGVPNSYTAATTSFNNMIANAGVDNVSIEAIGSGVDASYLQGTICYPQACDTTAPYNFPTQGFYIPVADAQGYASAISYKVGVVTGGNIPEPATLALLGIGLVGLGAARLRKA